MASDQEVAEFHRFILAQKIAYEKREQSRAEINYGKVMGKSAKALIEFTKIATFDQLLRAEASFQENDLTTYAKMPATLQSVNEGIHDFKDGEVVYRQLLNHPDAYKEHRYREKERVPPDKIIPLDAMRRALRGQAARIGNYRKNVMGNPREQEFMSARAAMIRHAEKLYDAIQRTKLLPPDQ